MTFGHTPEFRKILWGGLVAWLIQGCVILAWMLGSRSSVDPRDPAFVLNNPSEISHASALDKFGK